MIKLKHVFLLASVCMMFNITASDDESSKPRQAVSRDKSVTAKRSSSAERKLSDERPPVSISTTAQGLSSNSSIIETTAKPYSESHYALTTFAGRKNRSYLKGRNEDGSLLAALRSAVDIVRAQNLYNRSVGEAYTKPIIEDEHNQSRLADTIAIGKKHSKLFAAEANPTIKRRDSFDSDDSDYIDSERSQSLSKSSGGSSRVPAVTPTTKLELDPNLARTFLPTQQQALVRLVTDQQTNKRPVFAQTRDAAKQEAQRVEAAAKEITEALERTALEAIENERQFYTSKWNSETSAAQSRRAEQLQLLANAKQAKENEADRLFDGEIDRMRTHAGITAGNLRHIRRIAGIHELVPSNAHKKANFTPSRFAAFLDGFTTT